MIGRDLEQDFRDRLAALRSQSEQESEALLQQGERERGALQDELRLLRAQEARLQEELRGATQVRHLRHLLPVLFLQIIFTLFPHKRPDELVVEKNFIETSRVRRRAVVWRRSSARRG